MSYTKPKELAPVQNSAESLIAQAIDRGVSVDTMERLLAMRRELRQEQAKEAYDQAMANFQAKCPTIQKTKKVSFNTTNYSYAPLEDIVEQVKELLADNGFSYTFDQRVTDNTLKIYCKVKHITGHMEVSEFETAIDANAKMNVSQKYGSASTYGKRYAFINAFGILTGDEDNDATSFNRPIPEPRQEDGYTYEKVEESASTADAIHNNLQKICPRCKGELTEKQGVSKYGKPYHALFCSSGNSSHTQWLSQ